MVYIMFKKLLSAEIVNSVLSTGSRLSLFLPEKVHLKKKPSFFLHFTLFPNRLFPSHVFLLHNLPSEESQFNISTQDHHLSFYWHLKESYVVCSY